MKLWLAIFATSLSFPLCAAQGKVFQAEKSLPQSMTAEAVAPGVVAGEQAETAKSNQRSADGQIRFSFQDQEWSTVIPWFADQAGFSLQNVERWPAGTFNLQDSDSYSTLGALDQLNRSLAGLKEPFTLIRKRKMLMLKSANEAISSELIDVVRPEDLDQRGAFELMSVVFDMGELDGEDISDDVETQVSSHNRGYLNVFNSSNQLQVRETGLRLRNIRNIIEAARKKLADEKINSIIYRLKFQDAETFTTVVGAQLGIPAGKVSNENGTFSIFSEPLSSRLYVSGTRKMLDQFALIAKMVDSDPNLQTEEIDFGQVTVKNYEITVDPELAFDLLSTMLEGSGATMQQDKLSGSIAVRGREEDHALVVESLASVSNVKTKNFAIIPLQKVSVTEALGVLQSIFGSGSDLVDESPKGPVILADAQLNQLIVSGTAKEVAEIQAIAEELDARYVPAELGARTRVRVIPMSEEDQMRLAPALGDLLGSKGRTNPFNVIRPEQRKGLGERIRKGDLQDPLGGRSDDEMLEEMLDVLPSGGGSQSKQPAGASLQKEPAGLMGQASALAFLALGAQKANLVSSMMLFQQDGETESSEDGLAYRAPGKKKSVAGAPIRFRFTEYGLTVESDDLDAADDMEDAIAEFLGVTSEVQLPSFFELQHRSVQEMQQMLEAILGLSDGSAVGGEGGEGGNPLTGMMNNMLPGGDLFGGLLGGIGGSDAVSGLEGDVKFGADVRFNTLWVTGATANDLTQINNLIDYWDRPEGQTKPELFGKTRMIKVYHRDVLELVELIKAQRPEMIYNEQAAQKSGQGNGEVAQMMKAVQQLTSGKGKGKGGGGGGGDTGAKQTVVLNADTANSMILVTGPQYLYDDILAIVQSIDVAPGPRSTEVISNIPNAKFLLDTLMQKYPGKLMMAGDEPDAAVAPTAKAGTSQGSQAQAQAQQQLQRAIGQARSQQGGGGGRTDGGRGGGGRGGGGGRAGGGGRTGGGGGGGRAGGGGGGGGR